MKEIRNNDAAFRYKYYVMVIAMVALAVTIISIVWAVYQYKNAQLENAIYLSE